MRRYFPVESLTWTTSDYSDSRSWLAVAEEDYSDGLDRRAGKALTADHESRAAANPWGVGKSPLADDGWIGGTIEPVRLQVLSFRVTLFSYRPRSNVEAQSVCDHCLSSLHQSLLVECLCNLAFLLVLLQSRLSTLQNDRHHGSPTQPIGG